MVTTSSPLRGAGDAPGHPVVPAPSSRVRRWRPELPAVPLGWLALSIALVAPRDVRPPAAGLDPSWRTGLDVAAASHLPFGRSLLFTYGPLGFLDNALTTSRVHLVLGVLFAAAAVALVFASVYCAVRPRLPPVTAGAVAAGVAVGTSSPGAASFVLFSAAVALSIRYLRGGNQAAFDRWLVPAVSGLAAVLVQVKFSEGVALAAVAAVAACGSGKVTMPVLAASAISGVGVFALTWVAAGQSGADFWPWLSGSAHIASGYPDAMALEAKPNVLGYWLAAVAFVLCLLLAARSSQHMRIWARVAVLAIVVGATLFAFKQGFTRHDAHEAAYFVLTAVLLTALLPRQPLPRWALPSLGLLVVLAAPSWSNVDLLQARDNWKFLAQTVTDHGYQQQTLAAAAAKARDSYALPASVIAAARNRPVAVDPWEASLAWAYAFNWHPVPVFQTYAAFTADLDARNATAARSAPADQVFVRPATPTAIDGRNPIWESPRYTLALACAYQPVAGDEGWVALAKTADRCTAPVQTSRQHVEANAPVPVPPARADQVLVASFVPAKPSVPARLTALVLKPFSPLVVSTDGLLNRLPTGLAGGPLIVRLPAGTGLTGIGAGGVAYRELSFNQPGHVTFAVIDRR
jgi:hypothetical protein